MKNIEPNITRGYTIVEVTIRDNISQLIAKILLHSEQLQIANLLIKHRHTIRTKGNYLYTNWMNKGYFINLKYIKNIHLCYFHFSSFTVTLYKQLLHVC